MEEWTQQTVLRLLQMWSLPEVGLSAIFIISLVSATLLPLGSEPAVLAYAVLDSSHFWPAVLVATVGNTLGGGISYWMGLGASNAYALWRQKHPNESPPADYNQKTGGKWHKYIVQWLQRLGPKALLLSWLPLVGDPLCAVAGWLRMPLVPSLIYMAIGKFLRYSIMTAVLLWLLPYLGWG